MRGTQGIRLVSMLALAGVLVVSGVAMAHGKGRGGKGARMDPEKLATRAELRVREELAPELGLDAKQTDAFVAIVRDEVKARGEHRKAMRTERQALQSLLADKAPEAELRKQLDRMEALHQANPPRGRVIAEAKKILTVEQQAKLVLILPKVMQPGRGGRGGPGFDADDDRPRRPRFER